jgi:preprotein translocase subunit SecD
MLNKYPLWKNLLVVLIVLGGALFALPNLFAPDPALQITGASSGQMIDRRYPRARRERAGGGGYRLFR